MRLVLDTCILVSGLRSSQGASRRLLTGALERRFVMLASVPLMLEYEAVLSRPEHSRDLGWGIADMRDFLDDLAAVIEPIALGFFWRPTLKDIDDEMVLATAVSGGANLLITHNLKDFMGCERHFGIPVVTPGRAVRTFGNRL